MKKKELFEKWSSKVKKCVEKRIYPRYLYKYRKLGEHTKDIIIYNRMRFSSPSEFNDPFDFNLPINLEESIKKIKKEDFDSYSDKLKNIGNNSSSENNELCVNYLFENPSKTKETILKFFEEIGVSCFSKKYDNILMWSHYTENHKGICLKFDILKSLDFFTPLLDVEYKKKIDLEIVNYFRNPDEFMINTTRTKFKCWKYEKEFRSVKNKSIGFDCKNRFVNFNPSALKEIIFGFKTDPKVISEYKELCKILNKNVAFSKMKSTEDGTFKLKKVSCKE